MTAVEELDAIRQMVADHWTDLSGAARTYVLWPNEPADPPQQPADPSDAAYPAHFLAVEVTYTSARLLTYEDDEIEGELLVGFFVQPGAGESVLRQDYDAFRAMVYDHGDEAGLQFLAPVLGDGMADAEFPWYVREARFPFTRMQER